MIRRALAIVDDHELMARGLANLLEPHHDVRGVVHSGKELLSLLRRTPVDCVLLDLTMPDQSGLEVLPLLKRHHAALRVIMVTMHVDRELVQATLSLGADGYVPKDAELAELLEAIETVFEGRHYISPLVPKHTNRTSLHALHPALASLTPRQEGILLLLGEGMSSQAIAKESGLSEATITFHRASLRRKLGIDSELGLNRFAVLIRSTMGGEKEAIKRA